MLSLNIKKLTADKSMFHEILNVLKYFNINEYFGDKGMFFT